MNKEKLELVENSIIDYLKNKGWRLDSRNIDDTFKEEPTHTLSFIEDNSQFISEECDLSQLIIELDYWNNYDCKEDEELNKAINVVAYICADLGAFNDATSTTLTLKDIPDKLNEVYKLINDWVDDDLRREYFESF